MRLLATKQLSGAFKARLLSHQFSLVEQTFIEIIPIKNPNVNTICDNVIFTSQNAVKIVLSIPRILKMMTSFRRTLKVSTTRVFEAKSPESKRLCERARVCERL